MESRLVFSLYLLGILVAATYGKGARSSSYKSDAKFAPNFSFIGTVDGKTYFAEQTKAMTWQEASSFCNTSRMHLATVTTKKQKDVLNNAYSSETAEYWTGGHNSGLPSQFSWEYNNKPLSGYVINFEYSNYYPSTCVSYDTFYKWFSLYACDAKLKPLCEFSHGK